MAALVDRGTARARAELADRPALEARMFGVLGTAHRSMGLLPEARALLEDALAAAERRYDEDGLEVAAARHDLARVQVWFGKSGDQVATAGRYIETSTGAFLSDGSTWTNASSAALKENFLDEDAEAVLAKLVRMPVRSWSYRAEGPDVRHPGPTAEDFHAAFGLGDGDTAIATVDAAGVALLAIQALEARTRDLEALRDRIARLENENAALGDELAELRAQLER